MITTMNIENVKLDIINWIKGTNSEHLLYKIEALRMKDLELKTELTEDQKKEIIKAISMLEE